MAGSTSAILLVIGIACVYISPATSNTLKRSVACPIGQFYDERHLKVFGSCKNCPVGQTTLSPGSTSVNQCVCKRGFWNLATKTRKPPCTVVTCQRDSIQALDQNSISLKRSCAYVYGQSCNYECHSGYVTAGILRRTCIEDGQMYPPPAKCIPLLCPILPKVPNSSGWKCFNKGQVQSGKYPYKTDCRNQCKAGYRPRPGTSMFIMCALDQVRQNGEWTGSALVCEVNPSCPGEQVSVNSPITGLATFKFKTGDDKHVLSLPVGRYPYTFTTRGQTCNITVIARDYRIISSLEFVADYRVECSLIKAPTAFSLLNNMAKQRYSVIKELCGKECGQASDGSDPVIACTGKDRLKIRWPTNLTYGADVDKIPDSVLSKLEARIKSKGLALDIVVISRNPPIVYPNRTANGGYVNVELTSTCINGLKYSDTEHRCV